MSLRAIPTETPASREHGQYKNKHFNPGNKIKKSKRDDASLSLKSICLKLVHFINRGSRFTYEQIDDLIASLHRSILSLQKRKQEMMRKKKG